MRVKDVEGLIRLFPKRYFQKPCMIKTEHRIQDEYRMSIGCTWANWSSLVIPGHPWSSLVIPGHPWSSLVIPGHPWSSLVIPGHPWSSLVIPGHPWSSLVIPGHPWSSLVIPGHPWSSRFMGIPRHVVMLSCRHVSFCFRWPSPNGTTQEWLAQSRGLKPLRGKKKEGVLSGENQWISSWKSMKTLLTNCKAFETPAFTSVEPMPIWTSCGLANS